MNSRSRIYSTRILHATITLTLTMTTTTTGRQRQRQRLYKTFFVFFLCSSSSSSSSSSSRISGGRGGVHAFTSSSPSSPSSSSIVISQKQQQQQQTRRRNVNVGFGGRNTAVFCSTWRNPLSSSLDSGLPSLYSSPSTNQDDDDESNSSTEEEKEEKKDSGGRILANIQSQQQLQKEKEIATAVVEEEQEQEITKLDIPALRTEIRRLATNIRSSNNAPQDATIALRKMFQSYYYYYHNTNRDNNNKRRKRPGRSGTMNVRDCTQVIGIWVKSRSPNAPQEALSILTEMIQIYKTDSSVEYLRPNVVTYTSVMNECLWHVVVVILQKVRINYLKYKSRGL